MNWWKQELSHSEVIIFGLQLGFITGMFIVLISPPAVTLGRLFESGITMALAFAFGLLRPGAWIKTRVGLMIIWTVTMILLSILEFLRSGH